MWVGFWFSCFMKNEINLYGDKLTVRWGDGEKGRKNYALSITMGMYKIVYDNYSEREIEAYILTNYWLSVTVIPAP